MDSASAISILLERSELIVRAARMFRYPRGYQLLARNVSDYDLILIGRGRGDWDIQGLGRQATGPGTVMLFSPQIAHATAGRIKGPYELISIHFHLRIEREADFFSTVAFQSLLRPPEWRRLYSLAEEVCRQWALEGQIGRSILVHSLTRALLVEMVRLYAQTSPQPVATDGRVLDVLHQMDQHFAQPLCTAQMARSVGLSEAHLRDLFKTQLGLTPMEALAARRIRQARSLLAASSASIKEIAHQCGFDDALYFSRVFRRSVGSSPLEYRQSAKGP